MENELRIKNIVLAILGTIGIIIEMVNISGSMRLVGNLIWLPVFVLMFCIFKQCDRLAYDKRTKWMIIIFSTGIALSLVWGTALENNCSPVSLTNGVGWLLLAVAIYPIITLFTYWVDKTAQCPYKKEANSKKVFVFAYVLLVISWLLAYFAMFPGIYGIDAPTWYNMWNVENRMISSQWSVIISGLFYYSIKLGESLGNVNTGFFAFTLLELSFNLVVVWKILRLLQKKLGNKAVIAATIFYSILPTHVIIAVTSGQDGFFAASVALCGIYIVESSTDEKFWNNKKNIMKIVLALTLMCIVRNNGLYAMAVMAVLAIFFVKKNKKYLFTTIAIAAVFALLYQGPIYTLLGVQKGTALREMLSIPLQQIACVYNNADLKSETKSAIEKYIPKENLENYIPEISDAVKNYTDTDKIKENPVEFAKLYIKVNFESPRYALEGALRQTMGLWYLNKSYPDINLWHPYLNYKNTDARINWGEDALNITQTSLFPAYNKVLSYLFAWGDDASGYGGNLQTHFQNIPILATLCRISTYFWILVYVGMYGICKKWKCSMLIICFEIGLTCTVLLSPLMCYRYYAPVVFSIPIVVSLLFENREVAKDKV